MSDTYKNLPVENQPVEEMQLDDARRIKVLSPGMLVFKRFVRNKLAVLGFTILLFMFLFSFIGPLLSPYEQTQVFKGIGTMSKEYAGATYNQELRYTVKEGESFGSGARAQFLFALANEENIFEYDNATYYVLLESDRVYRIIKLDPVAEVLFGIVNPLNGNELTPAAQEAFLAAAEDEADELLLEDVLYRITPDRKSMIISTEIDVAIASLDIFDAYNPEDAAVVDSYVFKLASIRAMAANDHTFTALEQTYSLGTEDGLATILDAGDEPFAEISDIIVNPLDQSEFLTVDFKTAVREAIRDRQARFSYTYETGDTIEYTIVRVNTTYNIKKETATELISQFETPSAAHLLGTDNNGMDVLTRLMFGGQVSLLVGFVVIFIELFIGIIIGGISGYFGQWVDTALMRFVDLFNSIPFYPMVLIFGSVMDTLEVKPMARIFLLMMVLGLLGWTGVARIFRGQILSLREQDFMIATEAPGIRTSRRIFRHLIPNVMPLLIVQATGGLGAIIIAEATLGFLGLGVKYPLASWGSIINLASDAFIMTNFWFMWIPAGMLILLTVLGFNFVGDGLRDAFDPKMKR